MDRAAPLNKHMQTSTLNLLRILRLELELIRVISYQSRMNLCQRLRNHKLRFNFGQKYLFLRPITTSFNYEILIRYPAIHPSKLSTMSKPSLNQPKLSEHFSKFQPENQVDAWDELWKKETTPWDRGEHNPALEDTLLQRRGFLGTALQDDNVATVPGGGDSNGNKRKKALVPGCGRGFDVFLLAGFGYDAYGLEYSDTALEICRQEAARIGDNIPVRDERIGKGKVTFVQGDFFKNDWLEKIGVEEGGFDLIYDYTVRLYVSYVTICSSAGTAVSKLVCDIHA